MNQVREHISIRDGEVLQPTAVQEMEWLNRAAKTWRRDGGPSKDDLEHVCLTTVPTLLRGIPGITSVQVRIAHVGKNGVCWTTELMDWQFDRLPEDSLIVARANKMNGEAMHIAAHTQVKELFLFFDDGRPLEVRPLGTSA